MYYLCCQQRFAAWCLLFCLADTLKALDKIYRQNNSTKPLLYAGGGWLNEN